MKINVKSIKKVFPPLVLAVLAVHTATAENNIPLTTEYFSQGMIDCINASTNLSSFVKTVDGKKYINADGPTQFTMDGKVTDSKGFRYFKNVSSLSVGSNVKFLDVRGMTKLTSISLSGISGTQMNAASPTANSDNTAKLETFLGDGIGITTFRPIRYKNLRYVSLRGCTGLKTVYAMGCNLMGIDLSDCPSLEVVNVHSNMHMSLLRLPETAPNLTQIHACHTNLVELKIPHDMGISISTGDRTINIDNTKLQRINLNDIYVISGGITLRSFKVDKTNLLCVPVQRYYKGTVWTATSTHTVNVGCLDRVELANAEDMVENLKGLNFSKPSFSVESGGKIVTEDDGSVYFVFNEGVTTGKYTATTYSEARGATAVMTVTLVRTLQAPEMYLRFVQDNPTLDRFYSDYMENVVERVGTYDDGTPKYADIPLEHVGGNDYHLELPVLLGNFVFVQKTADGKETIIGANSADVSAHYGDWEVGHVHATPTRASAQAATNRAATTLYDYALHREQPSAKLTDDFHTTTSAARTFPKSQPWVFSTHEDEGDSKVGRLQSLNINLTYAAEDPAAHVTFSSGDGTVTGIENIPVDNIREDFNDNANAPVEYYDLQGRRVLNPAHGLYILRRGTKVTKRLIP